MIEAQVDEKGRVQLPKEVRKELRLTAKNRVILVKEVGGYVILPKRRYKNPVQAMKKLATKASGSANPKKEIRKWIVSKI
jgi:AbrB family looped-hinge helix DNA binding protein